MPLSADEVLVSTDGAAMAKQARSFDFLLNTVPVGHDLNPYADLLKRDGTMVLVGVLTALEPPLLGYKLIGGMAEIQQMIDFCAEHNIVCDIEMVDIQSVNETYKRLVKNDVKYRFVIDMQSLKREAA